MGTNFYTMRSAAQSWPNPADISLMTFPGGERHVNATSTIEEGETFIAYVRRPEAEDLTTAGVALNWARGRGARTILAMPYLPAARSDHDDVMGVDVYAGLINSLSFDTLVTIDPHSQRALGAYRNARVLDHTSMVIAAARSFSDDIVGIIAADKSGASHCADVAKALDVPMFQALKHRDPDSGKLTGFTCDEVPESGKLLVVDDICDGGGTFLGLADVIGIPRERLGLWVTHGIFSNGAIERLSPSYSFIATTNSFAEATEHLGDDLMVRDITLDIIHEGMRRTGQA